MNIGKKISVLRKSKGMTQKELADKLFVTDKAISRWESGTGNPDLNTLPKIAEIFGVSVDYLLSDEQVIKENKETCESPKKQKTSKRLLSKKKTLIVILSILATISIITGIVVGSIIGKKNSENKRIYNAGINYLESGQYVEAKQCFESIHYRDSDLKVKVCSGMILFGKAKETKENDALITGVSIVIEGNSPINTYYEGNGVAIIDDKTRYEEILNSQNQFLFEPSNESFSVWNVQFFYYYQNSTFLYLSAVWK